MLELHTITFYEKTVSAQHSMWMSASVRRWPVVGLDDSDQSVGIKERPRESKGHGG